MPDPSQQSGFTCVGSEQTPCLLATRPGPCRPCFGAGTAEADKTGMWSSFLFLFVSFLGFLGICQPLQTHECTHAAHQLDIMPQTCTISHSCPREVYYHSSVLRAPFNCLARKACFLPDFLREGLKKEIAFQVHQWDRERTLVPIKLAKAAGAERVRTCKTILLLCIVREYSGPFQPHRADAGAARTSRADPKSYYLSP